ncbi:DNA helicase [Tanacetum coccineum]
MLLCHQKGCKGFPGICTVNDVVYLTCRAACEALGLLENDREWEITLEEAALTATPAKLQTLLAHILTFCQVSDPIKLLNRTWKSMSEDIPYTSSISLNILNLHINDSDLEDYVLYKLEENMRLNNSNLQDIDRERASIFAQWLLNVGNRNIGTPNDCDPENYSWVDIPEHYCIPEDRDGILNLIDFIYDNETLHYPLPTLSTTKSCLCNLGERKHILAMMMPYPMVMMDERSMATTSISKSTAEEKGKMIVTKPDVTIIADLNPMDTNKTIEAVVYRKWSSKHVQTQQPMKYCCILLDKQGTPIQANMDVKDTAYFDQLLQLHKAYRISGFSCEQTGLWERTLDNPTSLTFGKYIHLEEIPAEDFPEHYFNFASYNELAAKADLKNAILTDYIGRIQAVSRIRTSGDATSNRIHRRIIDIQNLSGNTISLALWHDIAVNFNLQEYEALERPVVIAVSSCWVRRYHGLQLSSTSATHYYLNPNIPETFHIKQVHQQLPEPQVILNIENQRYENQEEEKTRNRFPLATIFDLDPQNYEGVRFTSEATIYKINTQKKWYYQRCASCRLQVIPGDPFPACKNHGPQPILVYRGCDDILAELPNKDPYELPSALKDLEGTTHVFQFHFDSGSTSRRRDLVLDRVFERTVLPLPAPPPQVIPLEPIIEEQPTASQVPEPTAAPISKHQPEVIQHTKPLSPALSTIASNQPEVFEPKIAETKEPQSTPPPTPETVKPIKGDQQTNLPKTSARKSLFKTEPEPDTSKGTKKAKHDK